MLATICCLFLATQTPPPTADDQDTARIAAREFARGERAFRSGDFTEAALAFERAGKLSPHASPLLNAAEAWQRAGHRARAAQRCQDVLALERVEDAHRDEASKRLERLRPRVAEVHLIGAEDLTVEIDADGEQRHLPAHVYLEPGTRVLQIADRSGTTSRRLIRARAGRERTIELVLAAAGTDDAEIDPTEPAEEPAEEPVEDPVERSAQSGPAEPLSIDLQPAPLSEGISGPPVASWVAFGLAGTAAVATAVLGGMTVAAKSRFDGAPSQEAADTFYDRRLATNLVLGSAVIAGGVGALLWILAPAPEDR
ncbi:MAG: hypothetical protein IT384_30115 [Deltaproteobacteria bacterium]|nr:hypothetical protein [Deltaproteobacteria bacterium]